MDPEQKRLGGSSAMMEVSTATRRKTKKLMVELMIIKLYQTNNYNTI